MKKGFRKIKLLLLLPAIGCYIVHFYLHIKYFYREQIISNKQFNTSLLICMVIACITFAVLYFIYFLINQFIDISAASTYIKWAFAVIAGYAMNIVCNKLFDIIVSDAEFFAEHIKKE